MNERHQGPWPVSVGNDFLCGLVDRTSTFSRMLNATFTRDSRSIRSTNRLFHSPLWISGLALGVVGLTLISEGHPRGNGDGPLTTTRSLATKGG